MLLNPAFKHELDRLVRTDGRNANNVCNDTLRTVLNTCCDSSCDSSVIHL